MNAVEADRQIAQMVEFIRQEAKEKAEEIYVKTEQEFGIQRLELIENAKLSIREEYILKGRDQEMQRRIQRSALVNKARLDLVETRNSIIQEVKEEVSSLLSSAPSMPGYHKFLEALVLEGMVKLQESLVMIRCRPADLSVLEEQLGELSSRYAELMLRDTGIRAECKLILDREHALEEVGVVLVGCNGRIVVDNTLGKRLDLAFADLGPVLRENLFP